MQVKVYVFYWIGVRASGILQQLLNISGHAFHFPLARNELSSRLQLKPAAKRQRGIFHCCARLIFNFAAECSRRGCFISHHGFRRPWYNLGAKLTLSAIPEPGLLIMTPHCWRTIEPMTPTQRNSNGRLSDRHFLACPQYLLIMCLCTNPR